MPLAEAESARARLLALVPEGFEERAGGARVELAAYGDRALGAALREAFGAVATDAVAPGWEDAWRAFHRAARVGGLWIGPPWEEAPPGEPAVVVDPGRAFGTGAHATTRLCVELLGQAERTSVLDAGCGSGVLAVAAARLGFGPVHAADVDPAAVAAARETVRRNGVEVDVRELDVLRAPLPAVGLVVVNIELRAVEALLARRPAPRAITSGYPAGETPSAPGWRRVAGLELEGWAADAFEIP